MIRLRRLFVAAGLMLYAHALAGAPRVSVRQYLHTAWTENAGQPLPTLRSLTQTADGYLWLSTSTGTLRFDGLRFSDWPPNTAAPLASAVNHGSFTARDGSVWLAAQAGLTRVRAGGTRQYPLNLNRHRVEAFFEGPSGEIWLLSSNLERTFVRSVNPETGAFREYAPADGLPSGRIRALAGRDRDFWIGTDAAVCRWTPASPARCHPVPGNVDGLAILGPDDVYASTPAAVFRYASDRLEHVVNSPASATILPGLLLHDRHGGLWVGTSGGIVLVSGGAAETYTRKDGLSGEVIESIVEDTEGDIWVATHTGIDRFRRPRVLHVSTPDGLSGEMISAVKATRDGSVWVGALGRTLNRIYGGKVVAYTEKDGLPPRLPIAMGEDPEGRLWVTSANAVSVFQNGRFTAMPVSGMERPYAVAPDSRGAWIVGSGLWRVIEGAGGRVAAALPNDLFRVAAARNGSLWLGSFGRGVLTLSGPQHHVDRINGLGPGAPREILEDSAGSMWIAAGAALNRVRNGKVTVWGAGQGLNAGEIAGMAIDRAGTLWIASANVLLRAPLAELNLSRDGEPLPVRFAAVEPRDGFRPPAAAGMSYPRITAAPDGRVWVAERDGVAVVDPELLRPNTVPPPVVIEQLAVDGVPLSGPDLRFRGRQLQITYTGNSLMAPERVSFRYRLDPGDSGWIDAEHRREMTFVGLEPGNYRFRVTACNLDAVCNESGAAIDFRVMPYFYQTIWFKLAMVAAGLSFVWGIYRFRMRQLVARFQLVAQERARVTREIHDSLLQGFAGVVLQLDAASRTFDTNPVASKDRLNRALDQADNSLREARQMLLDMRLPILEDRSISEALAEVGAEATRNTPITFHVRSRGVERSLPYAAQAALFLIGREAVNNAVNHANPSHISVHVIAGEKDVRLVVQDDGSGFDLEAARRKAGHLGVVGMAERAKQVGAEFKIDTAPGRGARVEVVVPRKTG